MELEERSSRFIKMTRRSWAPALTAPPFLRPRSPQDGVHAEATLQPYLAEQPVVKTLVFSPRISRRAVRIQIIHNPARTVSLTLPPFLKSNKYPIKIRGEPRRSRLSHGHCQAVRPRLPRCRPSVCEAGACTLAPAGARRFPICSVLPRSCGRDERPER